MEEVRKPRIKYEQPYSLRIRTGNTALDADLIEKAHHTAKRKAKKSKK